MSFPFRKMTNLFLEVLLLEHDLFLLELESESAILVFELYNIELLLLIRFPHLLQLALQT